MAPERDREWCAIRRTNTHRLLVRVCATTSRQTSARQRTQTRCNAVNTICCTNPHHSGIKKRSWFVAGLGRFCGWALETVHEREGPVLVCSLANGGYSHQHSHPGRGWRPAPPAWWGRCQTKPGCLQKPAWSCAAGLMRGLAVAWCVPAPQIALSGPPVAVLKLNHTQGDQWQGRSDPIQFSKLL